MSNRGDNIHLRKDKRWEARFHLPGEKKIRSVYGHSFEECKKKRLIAIREYKSDIDPAPDVSAAKMELRDLGERWLVFVHSNNKGSTYSKYQYLYRRYIEKSLKDHNGKVIDCNAEIFDRFGITAPSIKMCCVTILNGIIRYGVDAGILTTENFIVKANYEVRTPKKIEIFTDAETASLVNYLLEGSIEANRLGVYLGLTNGLRLGEICALRWEDVDLETKTLHIRRTVQRIANEGGNHKTNLVESTPKSKSSEREIPLSDQMIGLLRGMERTGEYIIGGDRPVDPRTYEYRFRRYQINAGITPRNFHVLRHTFATNCISTEGDVKAVSEMLGHSDIRITLNRYMHPTMDNKREYVNKLSDKYGQMRGQAKKAA